MIPNHAVLRRTWEEVGYIRVPKAVPFFYVLRYAAWRQMECQPLTGSHYHHQSIWDIRSMPEIYSAFAVILNSPALWAELCKPESADALGLLSVNINGSSVTLQEEEQIVVLEAKLAELIILDQRRFRIIGQHEPHWLLLGYVPAQENNSGLVKQREQAYLAGQATPVFLTELGQKLLGLHRW
ncbi:hypothetical protein [Paenibacillus pedocola]|uniref:hypothetical protein n=1 Tax=Paenibacillus pedocola TaxID=3242193 RepID=UPI0028775B32|nr:hypothetical protein [Paenibacillus typhae]